MNNLLSYCGLVDAKIRASDKDLPVPKFSRVTLTRGTNKGISAMVNGTQLSFDKRSGNNLKIFLING